MDWYTTVKRYYDMGTYKKDSNDPLYVGKFCEFGKITPEQFKEITGETYST
ncbi:MULTISPECIES: XkdX family protein [unclassified Paenibacillus]|uniref:XkdX family protein n=1 Tax=unclassified Paenibacillus TaxID=185978 RepID=UPI000887E687|nr:MULTISPECIES: XkdX family protein [unclassified Paenibacillus]SDE33630.1 phage uncharacterized protein, XkdX family [Paenibacillus sp. cl6col]